MCRKHLHLLKSKYNVCLDETHLEVLNKHLRVAACWDRQNSVVVVIHDCFSNTHPSVSNPLAHGSYDDYTEWRASTYIFLLRSACRSKLAFFLTLLVLFLHLFILCVCPLHHLLMNISTFQSEMLTFVSNNRLKAALFIWKSSCLAVINYDLFCWSSLRADVFGMNGN